MTLPVLLALGTAAIHAEDAGDASAASRSAGQAEMAETATADAATPAAASDSADSQAAGAWTSRWRSGEQLYQKLCGLCHDPSVGVGRNIAGRGLPEAYVQFIVRNGFNGMPAFPASYIDDESIRLVTEFLAAQPLPEGGP
ncbi:MAG: cytochrome c [Xanthomonadales bacterium]|nr:cytochrome c [Xanthomonadales bacterium]